MQQVATRKEDAMAYGLMYEGDGFIRKGPSPEEAGGKEVQVQAAPAKAEKPARSAGHGITWFRLTRLVFGR
jgi:hypothetical protein